MGQTTLILMIITVISKIFGFVRESVMAAYIGAGELKSIYTTAMTIPNMLTGIIVTGILSAYIPVYNKALNEKGEKRAKDFTSNLINILMIYGAVAVVFVIIFARPLSILFSPKLSGESLKIAVNFTRIMSFSIFAYLSSSVIRGYLNIKGNFIEPDVVGFILNILIIISTILTGNIGNPYILIVGTLLAQIFQFIRFPSVSRRLGYSHKKVVDFKDPYFKSLMIIMLPIIISSAADQLSILIDNSMASAFFGVASVSKIFYAKTMLNFIMGVVTLTVATVSFPDIARLGQSGDIDGMKESVSSSIITSMLLVIPATFGMMALANPIIQLAFERRAFTASDTAIVSSLLVSYGPYIIFASVIKIMANGFYAIGDAKTPVRIVLIQQIVNVILNVILVKLFGIDGLGYATSLSTFIGSLLMVLSFSKKIGNYKDNNLIISIIKITLLSLLISALAKFIYGYLINNYSLIISLFISVAIAGLVFIVLILLVKIPELYDLRHSIKNKLSKNKWE